CARFGGSACVTCYALRHVSTSVLCPDSRRTSMLHTGVRFSSSAGGTTALEAFMYRSVLLLCVASFLGALPLCAQDQQLQSLAEAARQARKAKEEREKTATAPAKVFNDDNFHSGAGSKADLAQLASPTASTTERMAA